MRRGLIAALLALGWVGCASPQRVEKSAMRHEERAVQLEAEGRYHEAQEEREAAAKQRTKAAVRANGYGPHSYPYWYGG